MTLLDFYKDYLNWINSGAPDREPYSRRVGLCTNLLYFANQFKEENENDDLALELFYQMRLQFRRAGLSETYPFIDRDDFAKEGREENAHLNETRILWVKNQINKAKEAEGWHYE